MTDTRDEVVARMREFMKTSHSETEYRLLLEEGLDLIVTLSRQLAEAQRELEEWKKGNRLHVAAENVANERRKEAERRLAETQAVADRLVAENNALWWAWGELSADLRADMAAEAKTPQHRTILSAHPAAMGTTK